MISQPDRLPKRRTTDGPQPSLPGLIAGLASEVSKFRKAVQRELERRPTEWQARVTRAKTLGWIVGGAIVGIQLYNVSAGGCSAGTKAQRAIVALIAGRIHSLADLKAAYGFAVPQPGCDIGFPLVSHSPGVLWPSVFNLVGVGVYVVLLLIIVLSVLVVKIGADREERKNQQQQEREEA